MPFLDEKMQYCTRSAKNFTNKYVLTPTQPRTIILNFQWYNNCFLWMCRKGNRHGRDTVQIWWDSPLCQFWPPSGDIQKCIPLTTPLTKNFFEYRTNMCISCYWSMCMHSTWSVTLSGVCIYILGPILPYFIFQQCVNYARNSHFHDMIVYLGVRYGNQVS